MMADNFDDDDIVIACDDWSHSGKLCKCYSCNRIARCTPELDFYAKEDGDPLQCEECFDKEIRAKGFVPYYTNPSSPKHKKGNLPN